MRDAPSEAFLRKLRYARTRVVASQPFFASLLLSARVHEVRGGPREVAYTDGRDVYVSRAFAHAATKEELAFVLLHEVMHLALQHQVRALRAGYHLPLWNLATDLVLNAALRPLWSDPGSGIAFLRGAVYDPRFADLSADEAYRRLLDETTPEEKLALETAYRDAVGLPPEPRVDGDDGGADSGRGTDGADEHDPATTDAPPGVGRPFAGARLGGDLRTDRLPPAELRQAALEWRQALAAASYQARRWGDLPAAIERHVRELLYPKVDWRVALHELVRAYPADYAWHHQDRRFTDSRFVVPSLHGEEVDIVVALDTSGSFGDGQLAGALTEVRALCASFDRVRLTVLACATAVGSVTEVTSAHDLPAVRLAGGEGTDLRPPFAWVTQNRPATAGLVYFTDLRGPLPTERPPYPVLWVVSMAASLDVPFGRVVEY